MVIHRDSSQSNNEVVDRSLEENRHNRAGGGLSSSPLSTTSTKQISKYTERIANIPIAKKEFYIGYRRRGPDEIDMPGIADCKIIYCRIHKESILPEKNDLWRRLGILAGVSKNPNEKIKTEQNMKNNQNLERGKSSGITSSMQGIKARKTAAVVKNSLLTGAEIAKSVVTHGREKLRMAVASSVNDSAPSSHGFDEKGPTNVVDLEKSFDSLDDNKAFFSHYDTGGSILMHNIDSKQLNDDSYSSSLYNILNLESLIDIPKGYDELIIPEMYQQIRLPVPLVPSKYSPRSERSKVSDFDSTMKGDVLTLGKCRNKIQMHETYLLDCCERPSDNVNEGIGVEAYVDKNALLHLSPNFSKAGLSKNKCNPWSQVKEPSNTCYTNSLSNVFMNDSFASQHETGISLETLMPMIVKENSLPGSFDLSERRRCKYEYIPLLLIRRQKVGNEERYHEDPSIVDLGITFIGLDGNPVMPVDEEEDDEEQKNSLDPVLGMSSWMTAMCSEKIQESSENCNAENYTNDISVIFGTPRIIQRRNLPLGFLDTPFATRVLDRFPKKDYQGVPLPEEELPMFCYPTGCKLLRSKYQDAPLPEHYGFVVKNERGDNVYGEVA
jgi:hypothetical protein